MNTHKKIICAAVKVADVNKPDNFFLIKGNRHWNCRFLLSQGVFTKELQELNCEKIITTDGFLTNDWEFLDRKEAWKIVVHNGQLLRLDEEGNIIDYEGIDELDSLYLW